MIGAGSWAVAAVDLGSTETKGAIFDRRGESHAVAAQRIERRHEGVRVEHDPDELVASVEAVLAELSRRVRPDAIALACQRSTCLLWERETGRALTPAVSWQDRRAVDRVEALGSAAELVAARTGLRLSAFYAGPKLAMLLDELPEGRRRAESGELVAGTLDAYLMRRLVGRDLTEPGHAGRTLLYDLDRDRWDDELAALFGVPSRALPEIVPSVTDRGAIDGTPLTVVLGDQQAALLGHCGREPEGTAVHFGTGAFVLAGVGSEPRRQAGLLAAVTWSGEEQRHFQLEGSVNSAGSAVDWAAAMVGVELKALAAEELDPESLPWCVPAFAGLAAPWWRPWSSGVIAGLDLGTSPEDLVRGVLLGVGMRVVDCVEALAPLTAGGPVHVSGKLARFAGLGALVADASGRVVEVLAEEETGLRGAASLALARAHGASSLEETGWRPRIRARYEPRWSPSKRQGLRAHWKELVEAVARVGG